MSDKKKIDGWLELLSDEQRADVMKTQIAEDAQTERERLKQEGESRRADIATDGFQGFRIVAVFAIMAAIAGSTCVGYHAIELKAGASQQK